MYKGFVNWCLLKRTLERGFACCSSVFFLQLSFVPKDKVLKTVKVTVKDTRDVGRVPKVMKRIIVFNSVVSIATHYGMDGPGIESRWGQDFLHLSRPALRPTQPPTQ